jgi:hypothetical protein
MLTAGGGALDEAMAEAEPTIDYGDNYVPAAASGGRGAVEDLCPGQAGALRHRHAGPR